jgi:hypothetical protein
VIIAAPQSVLLAIQPQAAALFLWAMTGDTAAFENRFYFAREIYRRGEGSVRS